jgi:hypothetical protein
MDGMSRGRSSFKSSTEQAELVFGFEVRQAIFAKKKTRAELPEVIELLDNTMFLSEGDAEDAPSRAYRHHCLGQVCSFPSSDPSLTSVCKILMRIFHGPAALVSGKKSEKARGTYNEQWAVSSVSIELLAWTATVVSTFYDSNQSPDMIGRQHIS